MASLSLALPARSQAADVSFFVVVKEQKFLQNDAGLPTQQGVGNPFRFGAQVLSATPGSVLDGALAAPGGASQTLVFNPLDAALELSFKFKTQAALDAAVAPGNYTFTLHTLHDGQRTLKLNFPAGAYPAPPHVSNFNAAQAITAGTDFVLTWDAFAGGTTNDLILLRIGDITGTQLLFETGEPGQPGILDGTATSVVIPANTFSASSNYLAELSFFKVVTKDATSYSGALGAAAFGSFSDFSLNASASQLQFDFVVRHFAFGGDFFGGFTPVIATPVAINSFRAEFIVRNDISYPPLASVSFTGPPGSGATNSPADPAAGAVGATGGIYFTTLSTNPPIAPAGLWLANYKNSLHRFTLSDPQATVRLVVPLPTVTVVNDTLQSLAWAYRSFDGSNLGGAPGFVSSLQLRALDVNSATIYLSPQLSAATLNYSLTNKLAWSSVTRLRMEYTDTAGNVFVITFKNSPAPLPAVLTPLSYSASAGFQLLLTGTSNHTYTIQTSTDLTNWIDLLATNLAANTAGVIDLTARNLSDRFYRAKTGN
ncbi:MAG: hypothetical protein HY043_13725 [Verrucomicrobia bacterium]|nr:hypothetical protein [Verrucomicrobiota bacterium]